MNLLFSPCMVYKPRVPVDRMGNNRARATPQKNRNNGRRRNNNRERKDIAKAVQIAELAREVDRASVQLPTGFTPLDVSQFKSTGTIPRNQAIIERMSKYIRKPNPLEQPRKRSAVRKLGPIEGTQRAIEMAQKNLAVLAKSAFLEAKTYLEDGLGECDKFSVTATDFMGMPKLTEAVMDHTFNKTKGLKFDTADNVHYQVSAAVLDNTSTADGYFPRPLGGEYTFDLASNAHLFKHGKYAQGPSFDGRPDFPHDLVRRSILFPLQPQTRSVATFISNQIPQLKPGDSVLGDIEAAIRSISTAADKIKYTTKPTSESVFTRDYQVVLSQVKGEQLFDHENAALRIEVQRNLAVAVPITSVEEPGASIIPLFEEAIIYIQRLENSVFKNTPKCLVLSSTPVVQGKLSHMHVLGDNAFTLLLSDAFKYSGDRHQKSMKNVGVVVGKLDKVERLTQLSPTEQGSICKDFGFLLADRDVVTAHLTKVIGDERQKELDSAKNIEEVALIQKKHKDDPIGNPHRLSHSFLANQLKKFAITTKQAHMPQVQHWVVSATFSFIVVQIEGTSRSYCFIQSFSPTNFSLPPDEQTLIQDTRIEAPVAQRVRAPWSIAGMGSKSRLPTYQTSDAMKSLPVDYTSPTVSSLSKVGRRRTMGDVTAPPPRYSRSVYRSGLPPELELELELL